MDVSPDSIVQVNYKSGVYVAKLVEKRESTAIVEILAVLEHPKQGDLHHQYETDVAMFHQRKALAYLEKARVANAQIKKYMGQIPSYDVSLQAALQKEIASMEHLVKWAQMSLHHLSDLQKQY
ncbi:kinase-associated lipoprotein B [Longirhabdus pacifica]|uniref:kinase-associated lipoprotein B n=1 Tax=Longirhabdus pacifica TaxID=2305227 RepID=UPI001F0B8455|nr:kinase-associated lipoprotein B [Longirhabdus pacifica]